ncbi:hypothetical protein RJ639_021335 [Escallonia herrerae]|uniref:EndoU domain-containing protein n=1 Tax=Escallonia herrerae TaxID=1293975 RepID=A0AA88V3T9_9ASTE|nr:hypothetical protein RJ639_021335 [Escallonia herrerae]
MRLFCRWFRQVVAEMIAAATAPKIEMNGPVPLGRRNRGMKSGNLVDHGLRCDPRRLCTRGMKGTKKEGKMIIAQVVQTERRGRRIMMAGRLSAKSSQDDTSRYVRMGHWDNYKCPPSEQDYSDEVDCGAKLEPSEEELDDLSKACNKLWELDLNRLVPGKDYQIDCGEGKKVYQKEDTAEGSLFSWLSKDTFRRPTYSRFCSLLGNYNPHEGYNENVTSQERQEQAAFIEELSRTAPIKYLHKYLSSKGIVSDNNEDFKSMITSLWFDNYGRGGTANSSAFEHVFVGEIKHREEQEVSGFHNWVQFYLEEAKGRVDYQGYIFPRRRGQIPDSETQVLTIQFEWNGVLKSVSSTLVGVSPEFEVALHTLCFYMGGEDNYVELGQYPVNIKCYRLGNKLGSAFPIAGS